MDGESGRAQCRHPHRRRRDRGGPQGRLHPDHEGTPVPGVRPDIRPCLLRSGAWWCFPLELKESGDSMTTRWRRED